MSARIVYRRLPGRKMGFFHCPSAWLADDHILLVGGNRFHESYQRVYLRDVQAILVRRKGRFVMQWPYILPVPFVVAAMFGAYPRGNLAIIAVALVAISLRVFLSLKFGCYLDIATAVGNIRVPAVASTRTARLFSQKVSPEIMKSQAAL